MTTDSIRTSLSTKILLLFILGTIILFLAELGTHEFYLKHLHFPIIQLNSVNYARMMIDAVGTPPDTTRARQLAEENQVGLVIKGKDYSWRSDTLVQPIDRDELPQFRDNPAIRAGFSSGMKVSIVRGDYRFDMSMSHFQKGYHRNIRLHLLLILVFVTLMMTLLYTLIRLQLRPLQNLQTAVERLADGDTDVRILSRRKDEIGALVQRFNEMTRRIREMLKARDQLLLDVSHELRSPLTRMKVALEFLDECEERQAIRSDIQRMEMMLAEILETERLKSSHGALDRKPVDLVKLIRETAAEFSDREPGIRLVELPGERIFSLDEDRFRILLRNVLDNALKFSRHDGYPVEVSLREKQDELTIEVQDFGRGIPEADLPFIFEPFYQVDKSRSDQSGGYGLGMNLSRTIAHAHDGELHLTSQPGVGTTIFMIFRKQGNRHSPPGSR